MLLGKSFLKISNFCFFFFVGIEETIECYCEWARRTHEETSKKDYG